MPKKLDYKYMSDKLFLKKLFLRHHQTGKRALFFVALFVVLFFTSFTVINWTAIKYNIQYRVGGVGSDISADTQNQLKLAADAHIEGADRLIIPKIGVEAPLVYAESFDESHVQGLLTQGLVHYVDTALPGEVGNTVIVGHSSSYQWSKNSYGRIFALVGKLEKGDEVFFIYKNKRYRYEIYDSFVINPNQVEVLSQEEFKTPTITLLSCWPVGTYWKRIIVRGELKP